MYQETACDRNYAARRHDEGFTLIELMIAVLIVATLASVGITSYGRHVKTGRTLEAQEFVAEIKSREELYKQQNGLYLQTGGHYVALKPNEPVFKKWPDELPVTWRTLGLRPNKGGSYFSFTVIASNANNDHSPSVGYAKKLGISEVPSGEMTQPPWYYVIAYGDLIPKAECPMTLDNASCTIIYSTSQTPTIVTEDETK